MKLIETCFKVANPKYQPSHPQFNRQYSREENINFISEFENFLLVFNIFKKISEKGHCVNFKKFHIFIRKKFIILCFFFVIEIRMKNSFIDQNKLQQVLFSYHLILKLNQKNFEIFLQKLLFLP